MIYRPENPARAAQDETIRRMWNEEGATAKAIAAVVGISSNAVIGRAHRMKLNPRRSPIPPRKARPAATVWTRPVRPKPTALTAHSVMADVPPAAKPPIITARDGDAYCGYGPTCRFPLWDGGASLEHARRDPLYGRFCEATRDLTRGGSPYCAAHRAVAYTTRTAVAKMDLGAVEKVEA